MPSQPVRPNTRMIVFSLRPRIVAIATASTMYGMARKTSVRRMIRLSLTPLKKPAIAPRNTPMISDIAVAMMPMRSEIRAP